jgi:hypothetical protein
MASAIVPMPPVVLLLMPRPSSPTAAPIVRVSKQIALEDAIGNSLDIGIAATNAAAGAAATGTGGKSQCFNLPDQS